MADRIERVSALLVIVGLLAVCAAAWLVSPIVGLLTSGASAVTLGVLGVWVAARLDSSEVKR